MNSQLYFPSLATVLLPEGFDAAPIVAACVPGLVPTDTPEIPTLPDIPEGLNIVEIAVAAGFDTLIQAIQGFNLEDTLTGEGPLTAFAPVETAFSVVAGPILECMIEQQVFLEDILLYHVVPATILSSDLTDGLTAATVQGASLSFSLLDNGFFQINDSAIITNPDIIASNGVVHVINSRKFLWITPPIPALSC